MALEKIHQQLKKINDSPICHFPTIWVEPRGSGIITKKYAEFISERIDELFQMKASIKSSHDWSNQAIVYNCFVRLFTAYDHDQDSAIGDGKKDITLNSQGIRETGTFLKTIALLPFLKRMGINTLHLLPITQIGEQGRKGDLGSPYAIKNPFTIDPYLADPILTVPIEEQYKALIEAAHLVGIRIVQEFIFRTAAIDSDWVTEKPEWFYWINRQFAYGPPSFSDKELKQIKQVPKGRGKYLPPPASYREQFGLPQDNKNKDLKVASAFADWPPDDLQPPWTDVTYLRLYNYDFKANNNYNYIAYNTIRFYDPNLAKTENINSELWERISDIIPYYQKKFGINGAMIDMGHALPNQLKSRIIRKAREIDLNFAFWDENFENTPETKKEGYNAVIGGAWYNITKRYGFQKQILSIEKHNPLPYFGTSETHNSPRYGITNKREKIASWILFNILPQSIPFLHNGFELHEKLPVNTGLNFSQEDLDQLSDKNLALFYKTALDWDTNDHIIEFITKLQDIKIDYPWIFNKKKWSLLQTENPKVLGFEKQEKNHMVLVLFNTNFHKTEHYKIESNYSNMWRELINEDDFELTSSNLIGPGKVLLGLR